MRVQIDVPVANKEGKSIALTLDTDSGEVKVETPVGMMRTPVVTLDALEQGVAELKAAAAK